MDPYENFADSLIAPAKSAFAIAPDDILDLPVATKALYVGSAGSVVVRLVEADEDVTLANVPAGTILPIRVRAVRETSTAQDFVGLV